MMKLERNIIQITLFFSAKIVQNSYIDCMLVSMLQRINRSVVKNFMEQDTLVQEMATLITY